tara:strand:- start:801 stop:1208 length:408 start_codon:yes stop_codon:yes gene_type:complete
MKIKTIFKIVITLGILQIMPLLISLFSHEFKVELTSDVFGATPSADAMLMFENFALVLSCVFIGVIFHMIGALSFSDESTLRRLSFLYFVFFGFVSLTDLIAVIQGSNMTAPLPVIIMGLVSLSLLYYGSKKGTV